MEFDLRPITPADPPFLLELYAGTRAAELARTGWSDEQKSAFVRSQFDLQQRHYQHYFAGAQFLIIDLPQRSGTLPIGRIYWEWRETQLRLIDISILASHRGRGIGTTLLRELHARASARGIPLVLSVDRLNPAQTLYRRLGFHELETGEDRSSYMQMAWDPLV